jgi:Rad3-related DNA helicase
MTDIQQYNPYPSFQPGQQEAVQQILELHDSGQKVVELNAPTAAGKSLDLYVLGRILTEELVIGRTVYTTPLVALVNQLENETAFSAMPVLEGKRNYPCDILRSALGNTWSSADDCPFENIGDEFIKARNERDNYKRYNMHAAVAVMQAAGRCTRSVSDFSTTYILDSSWIGFFKRCRKLFQPWFVASLRNYDGGLA